MNELISLNDSDVVLSMINVTTVCMKCNAHKTLITTYHEVYTSLPRKLVESNFDNG